MFNESSNVKYVRYSDRIIKVYVNNMYVATLKDGKYWK